MATHPISEPDDAVAELALLRRRFARSESARAQAEALLEQKSRILAQANDELSHHRALLARELSQRTRQLLDAQRLAGFGTMFWDTASRQGEMSDYAQALLGLPPKTASMRAILHRIIPEDRIATLRWFRSLVGWHQATAEADGLEQEIQLRISGQSEEDRNRMVRVLAQLVVEPGAADPVVYFTLQDVTADVEAQNEAHTLRERDRLRLLELEALTEELRSARETAEAANLAKTHFLAMMSHDIRTPMNGVLGMLELFDETGLSPEQAETLRHVMASGKQLRTLLEDIIDIERIETGKLVIERKPVEVSSFLAESIGFWVKVARDKRLQLQVERGAFGQPLASWMLADARRLRQLIDNLLSNAIKYTREGTILIRTGVLPSQMIRFEVIDSGIGIPHVFRENLFHDFERLPNSSEGIGGAGLGLAICRRIVEVSGGQIGVEDAPGAAGTMFWIELPYEPVDRPEAAPDQAEQVVRHRDGRRLRILVAEDIATNRIVAKGMLAKLGCDVELVNDGAEAVEAVQRTAFDLVMMDMSMPGMDGPAATRAIRQLAGPAGNVPILALTAYSRPEELAPMFDAGAQGCINKPILIEEMRAAIQRICSRDGALETLEKTRGSY